MLAHPFLEKISSNIASSNRCLCLGLDPDFSYMPDGFEASLDNMAAYLKDVIDATQDKVVAYKPNMAFFEVFGAAGLTVLEDLIQYIPSHVPVVLDAKRGDIGNTSSMLAKYLFETLNADAVTLHPYMGDDSLTPFFEYKDRFNFVLGLTSNPGAARFEKLRLETGQFLYEAVLGQCEAWLKHYENVGAVLGATQDELPTIRQHYENLLFLVPGVGAQGGDYATVVSAAKNRSGLALINMTRSILYAPPKGNDPIAGVVAAIDALPTNDTL